MNSGMPWRSQTSRVWRIFSIDTGWPPPELLVTVSMHSGMFSAPRSSMKRSSARDIHVALERVLRFGLAAFGNDQVNRVGALRLDIGARGVEMGVVRHRVMRLGDHREQDALGGPALVGRDQVLERHQVLDRRLETVESRAAGVGLVTLHQRGPLAGAHAGGARVGQEVDQHVVRMQREQVVIGVAQALLPFFAGGHADRFDRLDAEGFDDGFHGAILQG